MRLFKRVFYLRSSERSGALTLLFILIGLLVYRQYLITDPAPVVLDEAAMQLVQRRVDSVKAIRRAKRDTIYPFNPNFMSDYRAYTLNIPGEAFDRLRTFREKGRWINSVGYFKRVTGISDSLMQQLRPYFKFPDWINRKPQGPERRYGGLDGRQLDLNNATDHELQTVYGVGETLSRRIIEFRERLGGFTSMDQLYAVYGLSAATVANIKRSFRVDQPVALSKLNVNKATASDLSTIPGISFEQGRKIWEYIRLREGINELSELVNIAGIDSLKLRLIALYLYAE
jgi:competence ComEA-like helix-hairpin-helix protein